MRELYRTTYKAGRGFTGADWWAAVSKAAGGKSFTDFAAKYVDGREPYPWAQVLPLAGLKVASDTIREARLGISAGQDSSGAVVVRDVLPGRRGRGRRRQGRRRAAVARRHRDHRSRFRLQVPGSDSARKRASRCPSRCGAMARSMTLTGKVRLVARVESRLAVDQAAPPKAVRVREGIFKGVTGTRRSDLLLPHDLVDRHRRRERLPLRRRCVIRPTTSIPSTTRPNAANPWPSGFRFPPKSSDG